MASRDYYRHPCGAERVLKPASSDRASLGGDKEADLPPSNPVGVEGAEIHHCTGKTAPTDVAVSPTQAEVAHFGKALQEVAGHMKSPMKLSAIFFNAAVGILLVAHSKFPSSREFKVLKASSASNRAKSIGIMTQWASAYVRQRNKQYDVLAVLKNAATAHPRTKVIILKHFEPLRNPASILAELGVVVSALVGALKNQQPAKQQESSSSSNAGETTTLASPVSEQPPFLARNSTELLRESPPAVCSDHGDDGAEPVAGAGTTATVGPDLKGPGETRAAANCGAAIEGSTGTYGSGKEPSPTLGSSKARNERGYVDSVAHTRRDKEGETARTGAAGVESTPHVARPWPRVSIMGERKTEEGKWDWKNGKGMSGEEEIKGFSGGKGEADVFEGIGGGASEHREANGLGHTKASHFSMIDSPARALVKVIEEQEKAYAHIVNGRADRTKTNAEYQAQMEQMLQNADRATSGVLELIGRINATRTRLNAANTRLNVIDGRLISTDTSLKAKDTFPNATETRPEVQDARLKVQDMRHIFSEMNLENLEREINTLMTLFNTAPHRKLDRGVKSEVARSLSAGLAGISDVTAIGGTDTSPEATDTLPNATGARLQFPDMSLDNLEREIGRLKAVLNAAPHRKPDRVVESDVVRSPSAGWAGFSAVAGTGGVSASPAWQSHAEMEDLWEAFNGGEKGTVQEAVDTMNSRSNPESRRVLTHGVAGKEEASGLPSAEPPANARIVDGCSFLPFPTPARVGSRARRSSCNASRGGDPEYGSASTPEDAPRKESSTLPNPRQDLFSPCTPALSARSDSSSAAESNGEATASVRSLSIPDLESVTGEESWDPVGWQNEPAWGDDENHPPPSPTNSNAFESKTPPPSSNAFFRTERGLNEPQPSLANG